jgi:hypothetical protein
VQRIFELYDPGLGLKRIAMLLNHEGAVTPKPFTKIRKVCGRPTDGVQAPCAACWRGRHTTVRSSGTKRAKQCRGKRMSPSVQRRSGSRSSTKTCASSMKTVVEGRVRRSDTEGKAIRIPSGRISGRPPKHASVTLLAGLATCGVGGGGLVIEHSNNKKATTADTFAIDAIRRARARTRCGFRLRT